MIYERLVDRRAGFIGPRHWLGNLRWIAEEMDASGYFVFRTAPLNSGECDCWKVELLEAEAFHDIELGGAKKQAAAPAANREPPAACRTFFGLKLDGFGKVSACRYRPDGVEIEAAAGTISLCMPHERYGAIIEAAFSAGSAPRPRVLSRAETGRHAARNVGFSVKHTPGRLVWNDGAYTVVFRYRGLLEPREGGGFELGACDDGTLRIAMAFHAEGQRALAEADTLFAESGRVRTESREAWEDYFASCPVVKWSGDYTCRMPDGRDVTYNAEEILRRQYWHWHCLLNNVYELPFNDLKAYMAPDKPVWLGVWSNDGGESLRALAHTNRHALVRLCLVEYVRTAINAEGSLAWYLHGTGIGCLGNPGDSGCFSHGVPAIVSAVAEYVEMTGDESILDEPAGLGGTVWDKVKRYMLNVYQQRDSDNDGMVEWGNLWEGGADDKVGCFFSRANLKEWIWAVTTLQEGDLQAFYRKNQRPVVNLYEQCFFLSALPALDRLARRRGDAPTARYARERFERTCAMLEERHWHEEDGFYYDWDVTGAELIRVKNQDAFYLPFHLKNQARAARLFEHLDDPDEFALRYTPTLARNEDGFRPHGYWSGGYWPREAFYIARSLSAAGCREKAVELLMKAICCARGKVIPENMNPVTGEDFTHISAMAYNALNVLELVAARGGV